MMSLLRYGYVLTSFHVVFASFVLTGVMIRFNYMYHDKNHGPIYKSIEALDKMGMDIIETGDPDAFKKYLSEYDNTICGRHPISVFLHVSALQITTVPLELLAKNNIVIIIITVDMTLMYDLVILRSIYATPNLYLCYILIINH